MALALTRWSLPRRYISSKFFNKCKDEKTCKKEKDKVDKKAEKKKKLLVSDGEKYCTAESGKMKNTLICNEDPCGKIAKKRKQKPCKVKEQPCVPVTYRKPKRDDDEPSSPQDKVIIIGAGVSGLSAGNRLLDLGINNVTILEASNRVGGRIQTQWFGDTVVDLGGVIPPHVASGGASFWEHPVIYQAERAGLIKHPLSKESIVTQLISGLDGQPVPLPVAMMSVEKMKRILSVADSMTLTTGFAGGGKMIDYIGVRMKQEIRGMPDEMKEAAARVMAALVILATNKSYMTADQSGVYITIPQSGIKIPLGNTSMITPMMKKLRGKIKYGKEAQTLKWGTVARIGEDRARIITKDGEEFGADYIIFTPSLGVLKERFSTFFCPALPGFKMKAIEKALNVNENKVFMYYKEPLWSWRDEPIDFEYKKKDMESQEGWLKGLRRLKEVEGSEHVLVAVLRDQGAQAIEKEPDMALSDTISDFMSKMLGKEVPRPANLLRSSWSSNHLYRGSHSSTGLDDLALTVPTSMDPSPPVIFFAGDSTSVRMPGTIAGAYLSGIREADKIMDIIARHSQQQGNEAMAATA